MRITKHLTQFILKILGRQRLIFWLAKEATVKEVHSFNDIANTFNEAEQKHLQLQILSNLMKSKSKTAKPFLFNFLENGNKYFSQLGQDCLVDTISNNKQNGFYIEIGVGNGKELSNTYFFEKFRNWDGILCEPAKQFQAVIKKNRSGLLIDKAIYNKTGSKFEFSESDNGEFSSISKHLSDDVVFNQNINKYFVETLTFNDLYLSLNKTLIIDYLSVDTEGSEYEILETIDFNLIQINCISVEHNYDLEKYLKISTLLKKNNFEEICKDLLMWDALFVNKKVLNF